MTLAISPVRSLSRHVSCLLTQYRYSLALHNIQVDVCKECIVWADGDKRVFLKQALETRLAGLYHPVSLILGSWKTRCSQKLFL
jgi:hypothetical protein